MKVPATPPAPLSLDRDHHIKEFQGPLWRIFRTAGAHAVTWDELRHFGPLPDMRFDPHPLPLDHYPDVAVMYTATQSYTAIGEVYQEERMIYRSSGGATIAAWRPARPLELLDLTTNWPVLNGAAASMMMDDKRHTQVWARAIAEQFDSAIDGLYHQSSINNEPLITLFSRTEQLPAFPARPLFHALLSDPAADPIVKRAKKELEYDSV